MRAALYVRVSTQEQKTHGLSVDNQIVALQKYCEENNYLIAGIYNDAGISARKKYTKRPALLQLLKDCEDKKIDIILFTRFDRWFRSVPDYYEVQTILEQYKIPWKTIWEDYDTQTANGIFKTNIMLAVNQNEADRDSERIRSVFAYKREQGHYIGSAPTGYLLKDNHLVKDPAKEKGVQALFDTYLATWSAKRAMDAAAEYGLKMNRDHFHKIVKKSVYAGTSDSGHKCEPYITEEQHKLILEHKKGKTRTPKESRYYFFSGMLICGKCGGKLAAKSVKRTLANGEVRYYAKYECQGNYSSIKNCPSLNVSEARIELILLASIDSVIENKRIIYSKTSVKEVEESIARTKKLNAQLKRLADLYADGDIEREDYVNKRDAVKNELNKIVYINRKAPEPLPDGWKEMYNDLDREHKKEFWQSIIKSITITNETKLCPDIEFY